MGTSATAKRTTARTAAKVKKPAEPRLRIRLYAHGLGDCLLLRFAKSDGTTFNVLIDCGIITVASGAAATMKSVVDDIATACGGRLDVVVMTHEHWDHASGFSEQQAQSLFDRIDIGEVWYGWTEDPQNDLGKRLRKERADKVQALAMATLALERSPSLAAQERAKGLASMLGFFGVERASTDLAAGQPIQRTRSAFDYLMKRRGVKTRYLYPDKAPMPLRGVEQARVFVLGPPQDESLIKKSAPGMKGREVYELAAEANVAMSLGAAFGRMAVGDDTGALCNDCPFDAGVKPGGTTVPRGSRELDALIAATWNKEGQEWRRIEDDWTQAAETLALNLDTHTNNTCVVLAFEFEDTGEVFLFPADAQVGNWLSWQDLRWRVKSPGGSVEVTGPELLSRTVFYKVGHHGSHNATLRTLGLEQMTSEDLVAFIPVFKEQAVKNRWMNMPFAPLVNRLKEKTGGRLLQSDGKIPTERQLSGLSSAARQRFLASVQRHPRGLYFECSFD
ncbi:hypothetical protein [Rhodoferax sp.]|uniref:hypothetical protein n=1 Tax=Rhodoferax sp. TaxID=50421 RepID=UPI00271A9430|nr:hypothetical protein [Rhodoferax sp.]MDO9196322.1 hypothetical protein [Rhodoferax sp.]